MITQADLQYLNGADVYAGDGAKIGSAGRVYLDDRTGAPEWISVRTGPTGATESFVPLEGATLADDGLEVPFDQARITDAPRIDAGGDLNPADEEKLSAYYGLGSGPARLREYAVTEQQPAAFPHVPVNPGAPVE
ncbi:PRC-barrel domain-containing protein [Nucisporomicrobium flavum]|uniref:PRC-barrel domain-containing protein n=1 Tax=Nucisporomicrobium flavum TaxID=2785915 RepID=UPI0018F3C5F1|nr:PRC-barrel domain-containing protein [Nucisporomicrobium flavum]